MKKNQEKKKASNKKKIIVGSIVSILVVGVVAGGLFVRSMMNMVQPAELAYSHENTKTGTAPEEVSDAGPAVYMTTDISPEGLMSIYEALNFEPSGNVAVKISTGESENSNHLRPEFIQDLVQSLNGTIVESNTAYGGNRARTAAHWQEIEDRGYLEIAPVDIMDEEGDMSIPVNGGKNLSENFVGTHFTEYDSFVVLSHFKGHAMAGYGGAIKNTSIGIASSQGKSLIHTSGESSSSPWGGEQDPFLESMAEAVMAVSESLDGQIIYINVMNRLSVDCDCDANPQEPNMHDIGILASYDPVALDKACIDLIYDAPDGASLINRIEGRNGEYVLHYGAELGIGQLEYTLISIDER